MYSYPISHSKSALQKEYFSRPDQHALVILFLPLLQFTTIHLMGIRQKWSDYRLLPTTICGLLGLVHFHYALFYSPLPYPFANYLTSVVETILLAIIIITVILNVFSQLLMEGTITRPLIGLGTLADTNLFGIHPSAMPSREDDFSIALLRLGTASFEATAVAGLQNEVSPLVRPMVTLNKVGVDMSDIGNRRTGFDNEITMVHAVAPINDNGFSADTRLQASKQFAHAFCRMLRNLVPYALKSMRRFYLNWRNESTPMAVASPKDLTISDPVNAYQAFLRGENISDDDDDPYIQGEEVFSSSSDSDIEGEDLEGNHQQKHSIADEPLVLFSDLKELSCSTEPTRPSTPLIVAHLTTSASFPLTRKRFNAMDCSSPSESISEEDWERFITERRYEAFSKRADDAPIGSYTCVICAVEPRDIICWPCRYATYFI
jgi:hypothetical protein